ncbi:MAG: hypothetical protein KDB27_25680 [Planctomycetales bacterium]|nr:hypothetical protein [Planctomycetales bacterium]
MVIGRFRVLVCLLCFSTLASAADSPYSLAVKSLQPTYYYQLNETDTDSGVVDSMGRGPVGEYNGDYGNGPEVGIPGPDFLLEGGAWTVSDEWDDIGEEIALVGLGEDNVAHASNNEGHITLGDGDLFAAKDITVSLFALGGQANGGDRLFTNNVTDPLTSFQIVVGNDGIVVSTNPTVECPDEDSCGHRSLFLPGEGIEFTNQGADRGLNSADNGWWHIVAATSGTTAQERSENIRLWLNGVDRTEDMLPGTTGWGTDTGLAKIGGRRADPFDSTTHSGAQDEVAVWLDRVLSDEDALMLYNVAIGAAAPTSPGDYNADGLINAADIDLQAEAMRSGTFDSRFDENGDGAVNIADRLFWIENHANTWPGDSNLDGQFNSTDFVVVFSAAKYETGSAASWAEGDWNGDGEFNSTDFVTAFSGNGYEAGPRPAAVPEPASCTLIGLGLFAALGVIRRRI